MRQGLGRDAIISYIVYTGAVIYPRNDSVNNRAALSRKNRTVANDDDGVGIRHTRPTNTIKATPAKGSGMMVLW